MVLWFFSPPRLARVAYKLKQELPVIQKALDLLDEANTRLEKLRFLLRLTNQLGGMANKG